MPGAQAVSVGKSCLPVGTTCNYLVLRALLSNIYEADLMLVSFVKLLCSATACMSQVWNCMHGSEVATFYLLLVHKGALGKVAVVPPKPMHVDGRLCRCCEWSVVALVRNMTVHV